MTEEHKPGVWDEESVTNYERGLAALKRGNADGETPQSAETMAAVDTKSPHSVNGHRRFLGAV